MIQEIKKSQVVRLWDVFFLGPFMVYVSMNKNLKPFEKVILSSAGIMTVIYNGRNWIENNKKLKGIV